MRAPNEQLLLYKINTERDPEAYTALYDWYVKHIYRFILFKVSHREDAEDLTAGVFLKVWKHLLESEKPVRNFRAFIYQLARTTVIDFYRSRGTQEALFFSGETEELHAPSLDPLKQLVAGEGVKELLNALSALNDTYREALILRHIDGLSTGEVAQVLQKSPIATRVLIHRAMQALKKEMEKTL
ncbi:MAG: RNA polymerase sigma factor [Patescibacteria group bacterium]